MHDAHTPIMSEPRRHCLTEQQFGQSQGGRRGRGWEQALGPAHPQKRGALRVTVPPPYWMILRQPQEGLLGSRQCGRAADLPAVRCQREKVARPFPGKGAGSVAS